MIENNSVGQFAQVTSRLRTQSAVVPALILAAVCCSIGLAGIIFGAAEFAIFFCCIIGVGVFLPAAQIVYFTATDKDRLQNEDHVERKMMLAQIRPEIGDGHSTLDPTVSSPLLIANPSAGSEEASNA